MIKIDFKKELKHLYNPSKSNIVFVDVPKMNFLKIDGQGNPNTAQSFQDAIEALYSVSYSLKFKIKKGDKEIDYGVLPLEGLWWCEDMTEFSMQNKDNWEWTLMIMQPDIVNNELVQEAIEDIRKKKNPVALPKIRFESYFEGASAQIMYIGPYADEGPTIERIHDFITKNGYTLKGKHHEIYLSDMRRTAPEKLKTIIRQPVEKSDRHKE